MSDEICGRTRLLSLSSSSAYEEYAEAEEKKKEKKAAYDDAGDLTWLEAGGGHSTC